MSPAQLRARLDDISGKVGLAADLVRAGEMAGKALASDVCMLSARVEVPIVQKILNV